VQGVIAVGKETFIFQACGLFAAGQQHVRATVGKVGDQPVDAFGFGLFFQ
jgi:hypothetical protein